MQMFRVLIGILAAAGLALLAFGVAADPHQVQVRGLTISERVVRASIGSSPNSAAYMIISNANAVADRLMSASCACAAKVEVHETHEMKGMAGMMTMGTSGPVVIPAHGSVSFRPGGLHLMLSGLKERLIDRDRQEITLVFEHAGTIKAEFHISGQVAADGAPPINRQR